MMKYLIAAALFLLPVTPALAGGKDDAANKEQFKYLPRESLTIQTSGGGDYIFDVEIARSSAEHSQGLMNRRQLNGDSGMLFLFSDEELPTFWMHNTLIPLDLLFIARDGTVNHIHRNARPQDDTRITTDQMALAVLEINGGLADTLGIKEGDKVYYKAFRNILAPQ